MKIGMLTGIWYVAEQATIIASLKRVAELGFRYVDLHGVFHAGPHQLTVKQRKEVKTEMDTLGLIPSSYILHSPVNLPSTNEKEQEECYRYLCEGVDLAVEWGTNNLQLNAGQWVYGMPRGDAWNKSARFLQRVCDYAAPRGIYVCQEAEPYVWFMVNDIPSTLKMLADVDRQNFTVLMDIGHMALSREDPQELAKVIDCVIHGHFSDHQPFVHTNQIIGTGMTPTAQYLEALSRFDIDNRVKRFGYDELVISLELGVPTDKIEDPDDWVRRSVQNIQQMYPDISL
jgi:sugar phosphate isomerase/epimerase